jgi:uncharacterized protein (TIGR03083 family)
MGLDRVGALRRERAEILRFCRDLDESEWRTASAASGWRVQDVVAHLGAGCHGLFTPASLALLRSKDIERTNELFVDRRREWAPARTLGEYERWSRRAVTMAGVLSRTPLAGLRISLAELGQFPARLVLGAVPVFDHHTHLRHDIAPALGRPVPGTDANRMAVVLEWMFALLGNRLYAARPAWLDRPVVIRLAGPGGGSWRIGSDGSVAPGSTDAPAHIAGTALEFPAWATRRVAWRQRDVKISGDHEYAVRFLDALKV